MKNLLLVMALWVGVFTNAQCQGFVWPLGMSRVEGPIYRAGIPEGSFGGSVQQDPEWCWAASISNIFSYYGHVVPQADIVQVIKGYVGSQPATPAEIASAVNRSWTDANGQSFNSTLTAAYDAIDHVADITNFYIVDQLKQGHPLLFCNTHHCMDITAADFSNYHILGIWVFDPWPGYGFHQLPPAETIIADQGGQCTFIGAVSISDN